MIRIEYHFAGNYIELKLVEETPTSSANLGRIYWPTEKFKHFKSMMEDHFQDVKFVEKEPQ